MKVKYLAGPVDCNDSNIPYYSKEYLEKIEEQLGEKIIYSEIGELKEEAFSVYFIASGGAEEEFKKIYSQTSEPYILLTTPAYNSLAAAMEIMGFLQQHNLKGEILHGPIEKIAERLKILSRVVYANKKLRNMRLGCFGIPGGLISSDVDFSRLKSISGIKMEMFSLVEVIEEYKKGGFIENSYTQRLRNNSFNSNEIRKALNVYGALKRLIKRHNLDAITIRCFDLLKSIQTTGCLALAILNAEGISAACEGDQKSLVSMVILNTLTGKSCFLANPCYINPENKEIVFAHCTLPIDMPDTFRLTTHFESGIGVAITCDIKPQIMTIFKCDDNLQKYYCGQANLVETMHKPDLCRTQMRLILKDDTNYFLTRPIGNHHLICKGNWKELIDEFFNQYNIN